MPTPNVLVDFVVKFGKDTIELPLALATTVAEAKAQLAAKTGVQPEKQRLLLNAPVDKAMRRDPADTCTLQGLFPAAYISNIIATAATAPAQQHVKVTAMLIGSSYAVPMVDSKATAEISRLVATTVDHEGRWYRCCYAKGYLRQTAYVCRTCINEGRADPSHAVCLACAEMCHGNHEVEEWGVRYSMRCDCCTKKCWQTPAEALPRQPRVTDGAAASNGTADVAVITSNDVTARFDRSKRKRSRSSSPLTPKRGNSATGGSPISGVRVAAVANAPSPFALQEQPSFETQAVSAPVTEGGAAAGTSQQAVSRSEVDTTLNPVLDPTILSAADEPVCPLSPLFKPLPEATRCMFIVDSRTGKPPVTAVLSPNAKNRYPRDAHQWCNCAENLLDDNDEAGGIVCMLCTTCFWSDHMTSLHSEQFRRVPCYGDVVQGDTLAYKCVDCNTYVCPPCRLRCHKNHTVEPESITPSRDEGTDNGAPPGVNFSCGCRGLCSIAEAVPEEELEDESTYMPMPPDLASALMDNDVFTGFVCGVCMQEHPWLVTDAPSKCYNGELPAKVTDIRPILPCSAKADPGATDVYPYHGMIMPVTTFSADATCHCAPCHTVFDEFAPRATAEATELIVELHEQCDNCGVSLRDRAAFLCKNCEIAMDSAFMICHTCNQLREELVQRGAATDPATAAVDGGEQQTSELARPYKHDLRHEFVEDNYENVTALAGMQMMQTMDPESLSYLQNNWESMKDHIQVSSSLTDAFGQIPLSFTREDLETMAQDNKLPPADGADVRSPNDADGGSGAPDEKKPKLE